MKRDGLRRIGRSRRVADNRARDDREYIEASKLISYYLEANRAASCDTQPKAGDVQQAPLVSGAVGEAETPKA